MTTIISPSTSLIIPAYNEAARLPFFLSRVTSFYQTNPEAIAELIVVDDGSHDHTAAIARAYQSKLPLRLLRLEHNQGKGAAIQAGVRQAKGDYIIFMDADGATDIDELPKMLTALASADIAIGNRWLAGSSTSRHSRLRQFSGWLYRHYMSWYGLGGIDTMCGFKGYKQAVAKRLFTELIEPRWLFDTEVAYKAVRAGYKIVNFPIRWESKDGSKLNTITLLKSALRIHPLIMRIKRSFMAESRP